MIAIASLPLAAPAPVSPAASVNMASAAPSASGSVTLLEWNPHWKTSKDFGEHVTSDIKNWLTEYHVDFATIIEFTNLGDTTTVGENHVPWSDAKYKMIDSGATCSSDKTSILYDSTKWTPSSDVLKGCLANNDRPWIATTFTESASGKEIVVVGSHFSHTAGCEQLLKAPIAKLGGGKDGSKGVVFMADTNNDRAYETSKLANNMGLGDIGDLQKSDSFKSCCSDSGMPYQYDRIISTIGSQGTTSYPYGNKGMESLPAWFPDTDYRDEMHLPVVLTVQNA